MAAGVLDVKVLIQFVIGQSVLEVTARWFASFKSNKFITNKVENSLLKIQFHLVLLFTLEECKGKWQK